MTEEPEVNSKDIGDGFVTGGCYEGRKKLIARMPTERHAAEYNMKHKNRGLALIFNHESFVDPSLEPRSGTEEDCKRLSASLQNLHFKVQVKKDRTVREIANIMEEAARIDHTDNDCIIVAILSHGDLGYIWAKDAHYTLDSVAHCFTAQNCKTLAGKPKLFFIQACQGKRLDSGITLKKIETEGGSSMRYRIPVHADFLIAYSTIPGFYSWRNAVKGSWFIQSLCKELDDNGKIYDILTLLTFVCQRVAFDFESFTPDDPYKDKKKQIPCITSMLTRILKFVDKK